MKILFITSNRIGDAILSTGVLNHLTQQHPLARVTIACGPLAAPLFEDYPRLEVLLPLERRGRFGHWWNLWKKVAPHAWDMVIDIRGSVLAYALRTRKRHIWRSLKVDQRHRVEQLGTLLKLPKAPLPFLHISEERKRWVHALIPNHSQIIAFAPAANWAGKEWPLQSFIALEQALTAKDGYYQNAGIMILAAPHEYERIQQFIEQVPAKRRIMLQQTDHLLDIAAALTKADLFIGNDSGLMHMAAAVGIPTLGLFGPSPHQTYAPYGPKAAFIRTLESHGELMDIHKKDPQAPLMGSITLEMVLTAVEKLREAVHATE